MGRHRRSRPQRARAQREAAAPQTRAGLTRRGSSLYLAGELSFGTAAGLLRDMPPLLTPGDSLVLDLEGVTRADSAGLALLLEWTEEGKRRGLSLRYRNVPQSLLNIARFSNVLDLLPLEP